jgi:SAM-dependent methyltransferase
MDQTGANFDTSRRRMTETHKSVTAIWDESGWPDYYMTHRTSTADIYPSEWFFLKDLMVEGMSVLDIGCAAGGLASVIAEHVKDFRYTGVDVSQTMIGKAREKHPHHRFFVTPESKLDPVSSERFDLVVCLGVLHLNSAWRELLRAGWALASKTMLFDLRETHLGSIEDIETSRFRVDVLLDGAPRTHAVLPYNIINSADALGSTRAICRDAHRHQQYGYIAAPSSAAITPVKDVMMMTYRIDRV